MQNVPLWALLLKHKEGLTRRERSAGGLWPLLNRGPFRGFVLVKPGGFCLFAFFLTLVTLGLLSFLLFILRLNYKPKLHHRRPQKPPRRDRRCFGPRASVATPMPRDVEAGIGQLDTANSGTPSWVWRKPVGGPGPANATRAWLTFSNMWRAGRWPGRSSPSLTVPHCPLLSYSVLCYPTQSLIVPGCPTPSLTVHC